MDSMWSYRVRGTNVPTLLPRIAIALSRRGLCALRLALEQLPAGDAAEIRFDLACAEALARDLAGQLGRIVEIDSVDHEPFAAPAPVVTAVQRAAV